ncbi:MAG: L-threonylcarbamoyladenylate synthase [bacterium]
MLLRVHPENPGERQLKIVLECLRSGGVIIYPTDTVYAIGCDIRQTRAVERVARIKGIKLEKANFSLICSSLGHLSDYTRPISNHLYKIMRRVLPGPYTFILNANNNVPRIFQSKKKTVGIRNPNHKVPLEIVEMLGNPIMTTSVHQDDEFLEYPTDPEEIHERFNHLVDIVIDSGPGGIIPSTVVNCTGDEPVVIREGLGDSGMLV